MFPKTAIVLVALLALSIGSASAQFPAVGPAIGPPPGFVPGRPGPLTQPTLTIPPAPPGWRTTAPVPTTNPNMILGVPDLTGTWKGKTYGGTFTVQGNGSGYTVNVSDGRVGFITRQGQYLVLTFGSGTNVTRYITNVATVQSNVVSWGNPPPDNTSWQAWVR